MAESRWWLPPIFLGGASLGLVGGFVQAISIGVAGVQVPAGAVLVLAALVATQRALVHSFGCRVPAVAWFAGWMVLTMVLALPLPGGNIVISEGTASVVYLVCGAVVGAAAASLPDQIRRTETAAASITSTGCSARMDTDSHSGDE